jgi:hypothetical protein
MRFLALCVAVAGACSPAAPPATGSDGAAAPAPSAFGAKLLGEWQAAPPPAEARLYQLALLALAEPPDHAGFDAMSPSDEERHHFHNILRLRKEEPDSPLLAELRGRIAQLDAIRITFTEAKLVTETPHGVHVAGYRIEEDLPDGVVILEEGDGPLDERRAIITFTSEDALVLTKGPTRVPMRRVPPGTPRRTSE